MGVWDRDGEVGEVAEFKAAVSEDGESTVGDDSWPDGVGAVVYKGEY